MDRGRWNIFSVGILLLGAAWIALSKDSSSLVELSDHPIPRPGFKAPAFNLETVQGESVTLSNLRGQPVVLNLWASWCPPCRAEMPALENVYNDYAKSGLIILAINATSQDDPVAAKTFVKELSLTFPVLLDSDGAISRLYDLRSLPTTFFIDRNGIIREVIVGGPMAEALLRVRVENLLDGSSP